MAGAVGRVRWGPALLVEANTYRMQAHSNGSHVVKMYNRTKGPVTLPMLIRVP